VRHLIKAEAPLDAPPGELAAYVERAIDQTCANLGIERVEAVVVEIDLKRTRQVRLLAEVTAVRDWYERAVDIVRRVGRAGYLIAYGHSPAHLATLSSVSGIAGMSAQFNLAEPWPALYFECMSATNYNFVGMAPLRRGQLVDAIVPGANPQQPLDAVRWAVADPRVSAVVVTMSTPRHVQQVMEAVSEPLPATSVQNIAQAWLDAAHDDGQPPSPERTDSDGVDRL
jgi:aryl-alcohol dehydrogenase-like predicted oxidoreductase